MFLRTDYDDCDGREYELYQFDTLKAACTELRGIHDDIGLLPNLETVKVMMPLDGVWMDEAETRRFLEEAASYEENGPVEVAIKYIETV